MAEELELKAVVPDPAQLQRRLERAGLRPAFRGLLRDRRYDHEGELLRRDEVLRTRVYQTDGSGERRVQLAWKGPTGVSGGYKHRRELEYDLANGADPAPLLEALGYRVAQAIDRHIECYQAGDTSLRIEWYPGMDVLLEVEGPPDGIERAIALTGIPRAEFLPEALPLFVERYERRTGTRARLATEEV